MKLKALFTDDRGVSPVVGVALLIAIAVILATVIGFVVIGISPSGASTPQADLNGNYNTSADNITVTHTGGDALDGSEVKFVDESGNEVPLSNVTNDNELSAGETIVLDGNTNGTAEALNIENGETVSVVWESSTSSKSTVLSKLEP